MPKDRNAFQAAIGKLIVELDRVHMTQVEDGQPLEPVKLALSKAHELLRVQSIADAKSRLGPISLSRYFGDLWLDGWPKVAARVADAQRVLDESKAD
jgi:hypothetical protein